MPYGALRVPNENIHFNDGEEESIGEQDRADLEGAWVDLEGIRADMGCLKEF